MRATNTQYYRLSHAHFISVCVVQHTWYFFIDHKTSKRANKLYFNSIMIITWTNTYTKGTKRGQTVVQVAIQCWNWNYYHENCSQHILVLLSYALFEVCDLVDFVPSFVLHYYVFMRSLKSLLSLLPSIVFSWFA